MPIKDRDIEAHFAAMEKHHLRVHEWSVQGLKAQGADFVGNLLERYVLDLRERENLGKMEKASFANVIRKQVLITDSKVLIEEMHRKTIGLKA